MNLSSFLSEQDKNLSFLMLTDKSRLPFLRARQLSKCQSYGSLEVYRLGPYFSSVLRDFFWQLFGSNSRFLDDLLTSNVYREAERLREVSEAEIFHVHGIWEPLYPTIGLKLSRHFHRPLVVTLHGDLVDPHNSYSMIIGTPDMLRVLSCADAITTFSFEVQSRLQDLGLGHKSYLVPNFVDVKAFSRPISKFKGDGTRIIMVSRLDSFKDPLTAIKAFLEVKREIPEATLQIVGYGELKVYIETLVRIWGLADSVTFVGKKMDVRAFLWNSDIFVATRSSFMATLEAWAAGLVVVAPKLGVMKELIVDGKNGLLVPDGNVKCLAQTLVQLIKNPDLQKTLAKDGVQSAKKYDIGKIAAKMAEIYSSVL